MFKNRSEAGKALAKILMTFLCGRQTMANVVVALPRGGVPVAVEIAQAIKAPLTVLVSKKIGAPLQPEFAIGAVSSTGIVVLNEEDALPVEILRPHIEAERRRLAELTKQMELEWLASAGLKQQMDFRKRRAIIVDDGIATGMTTLAAADSLKELGAAEIIIATPVLAQQSRELLEAHCHGIVAVAEPPDLCAIGMHYEDFQQVADEEVRMSLAACAGHP